MEKFKSEKPVFNPHPPVSHMRAETVSVFEMCIFFVSMEDAHAQNIRVLMLGKVQLQDEE
jgi:hypothetical protein